MTESQKQGWSLAVFPIAGFLSALVPLFVNLHSLGDKLGTFVAAAVFPALIVICLFSFFGRHSILKTSVFIMVSPLAWVLSVFAAASMYFAWPRFSTGLSPVEPAAFFAGGFVGAFVLLLAWSWVLAPGLELRGGAVLMSFFGALGGGFLGAFGRAAGGLFTKIRLHFSLRVYGGDSDASMVLIWQIGMALIFGVFVWLERNNGRKGQQASGWKGRNSELQAN
ncbi:MAG: hypothetical protein ACM3SW_14755 [Actinomycetota bacterium]